MDGKTSGQPSVLLRPLGVLDEKQALMAHEELAEDGFEFLFDREHGSAWPVYCERLESRRLGVDLPEDTVPATFLVAEAAGQIVGRVSIRHALNTYLAEFGGHLGYGVRPGFRRRGYATATMRQSLEIALSLGLNRVLVTCDDNNGGSAKIIASCGGVLENVVAAQDGCSRKRRYWVEVGA